MSGRDRKAIKFKPEIVGAIILTLAGTISLPAKPKDNPSGKTITVCRAEFTSVGKAAQFQFNYTYSISTDRDRTVDKISKLYDQRRPGLVREDKMIECIKSWELGPSGKYTVIFSVGTTSATDYISIVDSKANP